MQAVSIFITDKLRQSVYCRLALAICQYIFEDQIRHSFNTIYLLQISSSNLLVSLSRISSGNLLLQLSQISSGNLFISDQLRQSVSIFLKIKIRSGILLIQFIYRKLAQAICQYLYRVLAQAICQYVYLSQINPGNLFIADQLRNLLVHLCRLAQAICFLRISSGNPLVY